jgi:hypothetical protein
MAMRGTIATSLCMILSFAGVSEAQEPPDLPAVSLGKPIVRAQDPDDGASRPEAAPAHLPTLGKPIFGRTRSVEPPAEAPAAAPEPKAFVERRPEPPPLPDAQIRPTTFALPPANSDLQNKAEPPAPEAPKLEAANPLAPKPPREQTPETLPMPRSQPQQPTLMMPGATGPMPAHPGAGEGVYTRPATRWEVVKYKAHAALDEARWLPAKLKAHLGLGESCLCAPDLPCFDPCCCDEPCCNKLYAGLEYLLWDVRSLDVVPLVTTTTNPTQEIGAIGQPGTRILYGGEIDHGSSSSSPIPAGSPASSSSSRAAGSGAANSTSAPRSSKAARGTAGARTCNWSAASAT